MRSIHSDIIQIHIVSEIRGQDDSACIEQSLRLMQNGGVTFGEQTYREEGTSDPANARSAELVIARNSVTAIFRWIRKYYAAEIPRYGFGDCGEWNMIITDTEGLQYQTSGLMSQGLYLRGYNLGQMIEDLIPIEGLMLFQNPEAAVAYDPDFYDRHREEILDRMLDLLLSGGEQVPEIVCTANLFYSLYPELKGRFPEHEFFRVHRDLFNHAQARGVKLEVSDQQHLCEGLPYYLKIICR